MEKKLSDLRFTKDVVLTADGVQNIEQQLYTVGESLKIGLKIHKGKNKFVTNMNLKQQTTYK